MQCPTLKSKDTECRAEIVTAVVQRINHIRLPNNSVPQCSIPLIPVMELYRVPRSIG